MFEAVVAFVGVLIGAGLGSWAGWFMALTAGRDKIEAAATEKRQALSMSVSATERAEVAEARAAEIEGETLEAAVAKGLVRAPVVPREIEGRGKGTCGCGHAKAYHETTTSHGTTVWGRCRQTVLRRGTVSMMDLCRCQGYAAAA